MPGRALHPGGRVYYYFHSMKGATEAHRGSITAKVPTANKWQGYSSKSHCRVCTQILSWPDSVMIHPDVCSPVPALSGSCSLFSLGLFGYNPWGWSPLLLLDPGVPTKDEPRSILESSVTGAVVYLFSGAGCSFRASKVMGFSSAVPVNLSHSLWLWFSL